MNRFVAYCISMFLSVAIISCDSDVKRMAKKMNSDRMGTFLKNQESERNHTSDSVRNLVAEYACTLPQIYDNGIRLSGIDTVSVTGNVWCKLYFHNDCRMDSVTFTAKVDSILNNIQPYKDWIKYGKYSMNVQLWCYEITHSGDSIRFATIPLRNY